MNDTESKVFYPLTHPQKRIWYTEKVYPNTSLYNIGGTIRIKGDVNFKALELAINYFVKKNEGIRLQLVEKRGQVMQYVHEYSKVNIDFIDFSQERNAEQALETWVKEELSKPFGIIDSPLFFFVIFKVSAEDNGYFVKLHHLISDGWSVSIMTDEVCDLYDKILKNQQIDESQYRSYIEYIEDENKYLKSDRFLKNKNFWNGKFNCISDKQWQKISSQIDGKRMSFELGEELSLSIKRFVSDKGSSMNSFFVAVYLLYLYKTTNNEDIIIGIPVMNRYGKKQKEVFGMFTNTMPFRFGIDSQLSLSNMLKDVSHDLKECIYNQKYPYDILVSDLGLRRQGNIDLFSTYINYYNTKMCTDVSGYTIQNEEFYNGKQLYSLQIIIKEWSDSDNIVLEFDYKVNEYPDSRIKKMYSHLISLITAFIEKESESIGSISLLQEQEKKDIVYKFNCTDAEFPKEKTICQLFEEQVLKTPDKVAIYYQNVCLTYRQLNEKSNQLARYLVSHGVRKEKIVGLLARHSIETVIGILGILKAGGAYLPIEPAYPVERIQYMLSDSKVEVLLTNVEIADLDTLGILVVDLNCEELYDEESMNLENESRSDNLAYIIYTSGSTGKPKGAMIEHRSLVNYICWAKKMYVSGEEVFPLYSSLAFDLTITSIFTPLICGSKIVVYSGDGDDEYVLYRIMRENQATVIKLTPSHLSLLKDLDNSNSNVKTLIVGGEDLKVNICQRIYESFNKHIDIFNEYGPTESTVGCMVHRYDNEQDLDSSVPIGFPADNVQVYVLDKNLNPVPAGIMGELYVSGEGVGRGYINLEELTEERFISNPFIRGKRMYRTGDLCEFTDNRGIIYIGREDQQVKIHGYRIELGEIEKYLLCYKGIQDAIVIELNNCSGSMFLCAYIVTTLKVSLNQLRKHLQKFLPDYMIPACFYEIDEIPLTINGKVDKSQLPYPKSEENQNNTFVVARNEKERLLVKIICEVLGLKSLSVKQNFFQIGGDSVKAIQISSKLMNSGMKIKIKDILSYPVIEDMANCIQDEERTMCSQEACEGDIELTPVISWFLSLNLANPNYYIQSVFLDLKHDIGIQKLAMIVHKLIENHDSLRINYKADDCKLIYNNKYLIENVDVPVYHLEELSVSEQVKKIRELSDKIKSSFDIENTGLLKVCVFELGNSGRRVLLAAHHLVVDAISWRIIVEDFSALIKQVANGQSMRLPKKTDSFQVWSKKLNEYGNIMLSGESDYWNKILSKKFEFPLDFGFENDREEDCCTIYEQLDEQQTMRLLTLANLPYNTQTQDLLICALLRTIEEYTGKKEIVIELEGHGREEIFENIDISRTVGWFTSIFPFYIKLKENEIGEQIKEVKEEIRKIPNKGIGYGILKYRLKYLQNSISSVCSRIRFNYLGESNFIYKSDNLINVMNENFRLDSAKENKMSCVLDLNCLVSDNVLNVYLTYDKNRIKQNNISNFMCSFMKNVSVIIEWCCGAKKVEFTPSDFETVDLTNEDLSNLFI